MSGATVPASSRRKTTVPTTRPRRAALDSPALLAYPMHGQRKLLDEGYRTRDGHLIEWLGHDLAGRGGVTVVSRPEPLVTSIARRRPIGAPAAGTRSVDPITLRAPDPRDRRRWWVASARAYPSLPPSAASVPALVWNPFAAVAPVAANPFAGPRRVVLDLLDDWSRHYAFESIRAEVDEAYAAAFALADVVTANGAGTADLARRHGRTDVVLLPNGCDPHRFDGTSQATGPTTVGYVGKIGRRLDLAGILATVAAMPHVSFVFAGPVLDAEYGVLADSPNVTLLGDVHYDRVPALLQTFDVGWVPHHVGEREVGGDVIKTYEYRAAGLPVLSTAVCGIEARGLDGVTVADTAEHASVLAALAAGSDGRVPRLPGAIPPDATWRQKADVVRDALRLPARRPS